jgi:hypothetical protein
MDRGEGADYEVPFHPEVPQEVWKETVKQSKEEDIRRKNETERTAREERQAAEEARTRAIGLIGADLYAEYRRFVADRKREMGTQFPYSSDPERLKRELNESGTNFLEHRGQKSDAISQFFDDRRASVNGDVEPPPTGFVLPSSVPDEIRQRRTNPWATYNPPFSGWQRGYGYRAERYHVGLGFDLDEATGLVENQILLSVRGAHDDDWASAHYICQIGFWHRTDGWGPLEIWVEALCTGGGTDLEIRDEWGVSDSSTTQENLITLHPVLGGMPVAERQIGYRRETGNGDRPRLRSYQWPRAGSTYWCEFATDPVPADTWVFIRCGALTRQRSWTNDVSVRSQARAAWQIRGVTLRTKP